MSIPPFSFLPKKPSFIAWVGGKSGSSCDSGCGGSVQGGPIPSLACPSDPYTPTVGNMKPAPTCTAIPH